MSKVSERSEGAKEGARGPEQSSEPPSVPDLLLHALVPSGSRHPDQDIVLGVAAELETLAMFAEGPMGITFELLARRLRIAVDLMIKLTPPPPK